MLEAWPVLLVAPELEVVASPPTVVPLVPLVPLDVVPVTEAELTEPFVAAVLAPPVVPSPLGAWWGCG